jgi:hypothetical protein
MLDRPYESRPKRQRTLLAAQIILDSGEVVVDCTVRNISEGGALVCLASSVMIPEFFQLRIPSRRVFMTGRLAWRSGLEIGIEFIGGQKDNTRRSATTPATPQTLRSRWEKHLRDTGLSLEEYLSGAVALGATLVILGIAFLS